ncbi:hypothetical protein P7L54_01645 [Acinetobacter bereziniae]|uniref:Uncharacterized protein n=1 Tax=Acinetobacter bereziniae LMG 1003 = CIP 70.12 TaxID=981324 RepID=N9EA54_ACIBZ|nr:hypothetical protein [Acinetobacter bereziniae]ENV89568.1 hypothetical protein F938_04501 [Acinetobacter bereziniae LMG 1003 = CIP 70.12]MBJ9905687.1 hypothetical protein [Acinetobacter bereziniae]MBJ9929192.1 hypothetical protein [Acinetobacter bereziniae]MDG3554669.1 hypothetical protein [Acinetobacter bereziniae]MDP6002084.1 hypothetical protein [Acinetobacter bereziniae]
MSSLFYLSNQNLYLLDGNKSITVPCQAIDQYKKNLVEIQQRKEWKTKGTGAQFTGNFSQDDQVDLNYIFPTDVVLTSDHKMIYTACLQEGTSINVKSLNDLQETEGLILRKNDFVVQDMAYDEAKKRLALSVNSNGYERHICILPLDANRTQYLTEGDCQDSNPCFDPQDTMQLYYDSCGLAYGEHRIAYSPKEIYHLDMGTGELQTVASDPKFDFFKPKMDSLGNLYFIKRPYSRDGSHHSPVTTIKDIIFAPFKIIRAIVGWLDFFTQRYTGESLKTTSGNNPAKSQQKSEEELFVEGNLIKAQQNLERNQKSGEKYPGMIPKSWELVKMSPTGEMTTLKRGVMSFALKDDTIFYSNGKYLIELDADQNEHLRIEAKLISKIICG